MWWCVDRMQIIVMSEFLTIILYTSLLPYWLFHDDAESYNWLAWEGEVDMELWCTKFSVI